MPAQAQSQSPTQQPTHGPTGQMPGVRPYRVQIADDHGVVRRGIRAILELEPGLDIVSESATGPQTIEHVLKYRPDLVLLDLTMPEMNGLEVAAAIHEQAPETQILILTMHFSEEVAREALRCGALGYIMKSDADLDLLAAIRHVRHHRTFFTASLAHKLVESFVEDPRQVPVGQKIASPDYPLTEREVEILRLLAAGESNKKIADMIGVSRRTVESHRNHIMQKMRFTSLSDIVRFAIRTGLITA
jgi:DNA-binding NarL/FixJ family response regulator